VITTLWTRVPGLRWLGSTALVLVLVAGCSVGAGRAPASQAPTPAPSASTSGAPGVDGPAKTSAADQLAGYFTEASRMDVQLRAAADLINGDIGRDVIVLAPATVAAVDAIEPRTLVRTIPGRNR
jgi:hypothetical protein